MAGWGDWAPNSGASKPANGATDNAGNSWGAPAPSAPAQNGSAAPAPNGWPSAATNGAAPAAAPVNGGAPGGWGSIASSQPVAAAPPAQNGSGGWGDANGGTNAGTGSWGGEQSNGAHPEPDIDAEEADKVRKEQVDALLKDLEHEIKVTLADKQADPNSPLYSVKTFEELNLSEELKKGVYAMGFEKPSKIQERALPLLLENPPRNMIAQSQSGTGKTAAFVLAMLTRIDTSDPSLQAICLSPARELADQTLDVLKKMGKFVDLKVFFAGKGSARGVSSVDAQIIVGTPGTIRDLIGRQKIKVTKIKMLVVDEADQMLDESEGDNSMGEQTTSIRLIISKMSQGTQFVCFSATFPEYIARFAENFAPDANQIRLQPNELNVREIKQFFVDCPSEDSKYDTLMELYTLLTIGQSIIFTRTKASAQRLASMLRDQGHKVAELHSDLQTEERDEQMREFRGGKLKVMIATNVIARGLDVLSVNMVINYDLPTTQDRRADCETYLHRVGRTGRFGRQGIAINMVASMDTHEQMLDIERQLGIKLTRLDGSDYEKMDKVLRQTLKS